MFGAAYEIPSVQLQGNGGYSFCILETCPERDDAFFLTVEPNGALINMDGEDVVKTCKGAYDNDPVLTELIDKFYEKHYKKEEI